MVTSANEYEFINIKPLTMPDEGITIVLPKFKVGQRIKFLSEKKKYTVRACDERYAICTKPFNLRKTVMYTIIDLDKYIRGTENLIFCMGFESDGECDEALSRLQSGESEVSHRNRIRLDIERLEGS